MTDVRHVSKHIKLGSEGEGLPHGSPKRLDTVVKSNTEDSMGRQETWNSSCQNDVEVRSAKILHMLKSLSQSMKDVVGTVDNLGKKMEGNVNNLEDKMNERYKNFEEKMSVQMEAGFKNEEYTRQLFQNETAVRSEDIKKIRMDSGTVCSEASTAIGLGSGTFARPPPLSSSWTETWVRRKLEFKGWNPDFTKRNIQGIADCQVQVRRLKGGARPLGSRVHCFFYEFFLNFFFEFCFDFFF